MAIEKIILGGGCFWCIEAAFQNLLGVESAVSGYAGGTTDNPSYREICNGSTNHAEVVRIEFDNTQISTRALLEVFFTLHDPTTLNRQGADVGTQYRSVIFYYTDSQQKEAEKIIQEFAADKVWAEPIVTEVLPAPVFYEAENYHQGYYQQNSTQQYCRAVISPKLSKLRERHRSLLKP